MNAVHTRPGAELACLVRDPPAHLPFYWRPVDEPRSRAFMERVLHGLRNLDPYRVPERR